ncbi:MAG: ImmA/IrrE family metallo-endopeptidase [Romboutsia sp.]|nr:ImmA/IrrE family metallo-endopeptidase [Romboutsia sp.]
MLFDNDYNEIEEKALALLEEVYGYISEIEVPVNLPKIIDYLGLRVLGLSTHELDNLLPNSDKSDLSFEQYKTVAGMYDRGKKLIIYNSDQNYSRVAFTIAHEIGHHVLHQKLGKDYELLFRKDLFSYDNSEVSDIERAANKFAACLLMPKYQFLEDIKHHNDEELAKLYGTSITATRVRRRHVKR